MHQSEWKERQRGACGCVLISWPTALGRHPRLRCGVLYDVANRTLSFHGIARDAVQFLLPLFEDWTYSSLPQLPSVRSSGARVEFDRPQTSGAVPQRPSPFSVLSHNSVPLRCRRLQVTIIRRLVLQVPPRQKFQSCEVWCINCPTCANRTSNNFLSCAEKPVSCGMSCGP